MPRGEKSVVLPRLAKNFQILMDQQQLNANQLAQKSGVARNIIYKMLQRKREPRISTLEKLLKVLDVDWAEILKD